MANQMITTERAAADLSDVVARLVEEAVAAERERCAKIAASNKYDGYVPPEDGNARDYYNIAGGDIAAAIRAQGSKA